MNVKYLICSATAAVALAMAAAANPMERTPQGVIVRTLDGGRAVRLQVCAEKIIRVSALPIENPKEATGYQYDIVWPKDSSLVVLPSSQQTGFSLVDKNDYAEISTSSLTATINYTDGHVAFFRPDGSEYVSEIPGGCSFSPIEVEGTRGWTVSQQWLYPDSTAGLYGLGQHQSGEWNYNGKNEELFQYNTKVAIPFVVSSDGYGILWDSYSLCRFGNPEPYLHLPQAFKLYDKEGKPGGLTGTYTDRDGNTLTRTEPDIYFEHLERGDLGHVVNLPRDFNFNGSNVVYEGEIEADTTGVFNFILYYSGYQTVEIGGKEVVAQRWRTAWNPNSYKFSVALKRGERTPIRIEWKPNGGVAYCGLRAYRPAPASANREIRWWGEMQDMLDYYFIAGNNIDDVVGGLRHLTGKAPLMPRWALGYWQSREKYNTRAEVLTVLNEYRNRRIPIDNIVIDWLHWPQDSWGSHEFDPARFPDPKGMVDSIHSLGARVMVSVWPKFYTTTDHYKEFDDNGWIYRQAVTDSIRDWVGPGYLGSFYDAYHPRARELFWGQIHDHYSPLGIDAWWMDASEPNVRDCVDIDYRKALCGPTALGSSTKYFNAYALMNAEAIYNGQRRSDCADGRNARVFLLTRSGFAGQQRYSTATWSGDIATRWEDMRAQLSAGLNFALCGIPYWTMDIGGFCVEDRYVKARRLFDKTGTENADLREWRELNTRWFQFGAFCPLFRSHGQWPYREIYNIAPERHPAYESMVYYTRLRYSLMPYLYSLNAKVHFDDYTLMRPLVMDYADDPAARNIDDQFMLGPALMVAPVTDYEARSRNVYFPGSNLWYDFYTSSPVNAAATTPEIQTVEAPYERIPLFVRAGSIIPFGPEIQWSDELPAAEITLKIYSGRDADFTLYEDENTNYNYENGAYATIPFLWDDAASHLTIGNREGDFPGMLDSRIFNIVKIDSNGEHHAITCHYSGQTLEVEI